MLSSSLVFLTLFAPTAHADQIKALNRGDQSFAAYYTAIGNARQTIDVATFEMQPCQSIPKVLLTALIKKAKSGVKVRLEIDLWNMKEPVQSNLPAWLMSQGGPNMQVRYYGSKNLLEGDRPRAHIKAFIVDGKGSNGSQIVGGRNWTDEYFGINDKMNYVDQDLLVTGKTAGNAVKFFDALWAASSAPHVTTDGSAWAQTCMTPSGRDKSVAQFIQSHASNILQGRTTHSCSDAYYVTDDPKFMNGSGGGDNASDGLSQGRLSQKYATGLWLDFLNGTQSKISMVNQYYMPWGRVATALAGLRTQKKQVEVLANATGDIDNAGQNRDFTCWMQSLAFQTNIDTQRVSLISSKGTLRDPWDLSVSGAPWRIHAKTGIRDGVDALVGSWNMDPRSYETNLEDGIQVTGCADLVSDLNQQYNELRAIVKTDRTCTACTADSIPSNLSNSAFCGGVPSFY